MSKNEIDEALFTRFLSLLEIERRPPGIDALHELVLAHMLHLPFENLSKLFYHRKYQLRELPTLKRYLEGIERYHFGGTCFTNNHFLNLLLRHLGYDAMLCGADMNEPDCHLVNMVTIEGREYLIDAGYAAPFLKPLPLDLPHDYEVRLGRDRYLLHPRDTQGFSRLDLYRDGELFHGYTAKPIPRTIDFFAQKIRGSYDSDSTFMNSLLLVRQFMNRSIAIYNTTVIESEGEEYQTTQLDDRAVLPNVVEKHFGIPAPIAAEALSQLTEFKGAWT